MTHEERYRHEYDLAMSVREKGFRLMNSRFALVRRIGLWYIDCGEDHRRNLIISTWGSRR